MTKKYSRTDSLLVRALTVLVVFGIILSYCVTGVSGAEITFDDSKLNTDSVLMIDANTGEVLYEKSSDTRRPMASTVKIMTAIIALENIDDPENYMIEIRKDVIDSIIGQDASTAGFEYHVSESFSALDVIYGLMLPSGCECSQILAYEVGKTEEQFVKLMNEKALMLGCDDTYFAEAHGLSDENYTTASDLAVIAQYAMKNELFREIVSTEYYQIDGFSAPIYNTNALISEETNTGYYYKYITGVKTGFTTKSGRCLVSSSKKGDDEFLCVALGSLNGDKNYAVVDSLALHKWAIENHTENVNVDIKRDFASVENGGEFTLEVTADSGAVVSYTSSDETVATVDENGVVTGKSLGQAKITATTQSGNFDSVMVSVGFENGIDVTSRYGDYTGTEKKPLDWKAVKDAGFDFAVIRAGWGSEDYPNQNDAEFVNNVNGAFENGVDYYLSFIAYAQSESEAIAEAEYFLREMEEYFPIGCKDGLKDIVYNMTYSPYSSNDKELNTKIALAFAKRIKRSGFNTLIFANKSVYKNLDVTMLTENGVGTYYSYYPYVVDFENAATLPDLSTPDMWQYRSDAYFPSASENKFAKLCIAYMKSQEDKRLDVDGDGVVSIMDATLIQRVVARLEYIEGFDSIGDVDNDSKVTVLDATYIQNYLINK